MQIPWLNEVGQRLSRGDVFAGLADLQSTSDVDFVDANPFAVQHGDGVGDLFEFDRLMTDVVTDTEVLLNRIESVVAGRAVSQATEEGHRLGSGFEHAAGL